MSALKVLTTFAANDKFSKTVGKMSKATRSFATKAQANFARAEMGVRRFNSGLSNVSGKIFNLRNAAIALAATAVFKKMYDGVAATAALGDEAAKNAAIFGVSAEALQEFEFAADRSGVSASVFESSMTALVKRTGELRAESGGLYSYLKKTGNDALMTQLKNAENNEQAMNLLTKRMGEIQSPTERAALANAAFSRSGIKMVGMMKDGEQGMNALRDQARQYGGVISNEAAAASEQFIDAQTNLDFAMQGLGNTIGTSLMPKVQEIIEGLTNWVGENKELIKLKVQAWADNISKALEFLVRNKDALITTTKIVVGGLIALKVAALAGQAAIVAIRIASVGYNVVLGIQGALMGGLTKAIAMNKTALIAYKVVTGIATAAQFAFNAALSANPIALIIIGVAALIALIVVVVKKWDTWGAAVAAFLGPLGLVISLIMEFRDRWDDIVQAFESGGIMGALKKIGQTIISAVLKPLEALLEQIGKIPGMGFAADAAAGLNSFREGMFDGGGQTEGQTAGVPMVNNAADRQESFLERIQTNNARVDLNVNDPGGQTDVSSDNDFVTIKRESSFGFATN